MDDLEYMTDGMFTRFFPNTKDGESVWKDMADENGVVAVLNQHADNVIRQIRAAGYTVSKAKPVTKADMDNINAELEAMGI